MATMTSMTDLVKDEISRVAVTKVSARKAEVATMLRFAGRLQMISSRVIIEAEFASLGPARRVRHDIVDLYGHKATLHSVTGSSGRKSPQYVIRVVAGGESLARQTGLLDGRGRPVRGLPPQIVAGTVADAEAVLRAAFLVGGLLADPSRSTALEIACPSPETALALVGAARRIDVPGKARDVRGSDRLVVRDPDAIAALLVRIGAGEALAEWQRRRAERQVHTSTNRLANFDDANLRRSARAAVAAAARVARALEILGEEAPDHLAEAGRLRIEHGEVSLEELGQLAQPPLTKDAIAGRIRRLLTIADKRARQLGLPPTSAAVTPEMLQM